MAAQSSRRRKTATAPDGRPVKTSVPLDVGTHARLCALAALRGMSNGALAAEFIRDGLKGIVVIDRRKPAGHVDPDVDVESAA